MTETARQLLYRHGLPEDVIDGALCLHAQELASVQRKDAAVWGVDTAAGQHRLAAADLIDPTRPAAESAGVVQLPPTNQAAEGITPADLVAALRGAGAEKDELHQKEVRELRRELAAAERIRENADFHLGQEMARRQQAEKETARLRADRATVLNAAAQHLYTALFPAVYNDMGQKAAEGVNRAVSELRRMAGEAPATEEQDCPSCEAGIEHDVHCPTPESHNWGCGCPDDRIHLYAETGEDTPGCDCGHEGMGMRWHSKACAWIKQMTEDARALLAEDDPDAVVQPAQPHNDETRGEADRD